MPGTARSAAKRPLPRSSGRSSSRLIGRPMHLVSCTRLPDPEPLQIVLPSPTRQWFAFATAGRIRPARKSLRLLLPALCRARPHGFGLERSIAHVEIGLEPVLALGLEQLLAKLVVRG